MSRSTDRRYADLLIETDIKYLAKVFELPEDTVRGFIDSEWCEFFGCEIDELAYYLLEDDVHIHSEPFTSIPDETAFDDLEGIDDYGTLFDIEDYLARQADEPPFAPLPKRQPAKKPATKKPVQKKVAVSTTKYSAPSVFGRPKKARLTPVPHYFVLVK